MLPSANADDYLWQFQRLLPRGLIWQRAWGTFQAEHLLTLMPTWVRLHGRANDLIAETFPCSTTELLVEWERSLGLPDACTGPLDTLQQRQAAVCTKFRARGGQSVAYYQQVAEGLGYAITIEQFAPFRVGLNRVGDRLYGQDWANAWRVNAPETAVTYFRAGASRVGEGLRSWGNELLECAIRAIAPAHTVVVFGYATTTSVEDVGQPATHLWDSAPPEKDQIGTLRLRVPVSILREFVDRARLDRLHPENLFAQLWQAFRDRNA